MIQRTHLHIASAAHINKMKQEVRQLLPLLQQECAELKLSHVSLASVILSTAHNDMFYNKTSLHAPACPVQAKITPLTTIASTVSFKTNPCITCVKTRMNYLASEIFCADFEEHCREAITNNVLTIKLKGELCKSFTTINKFKEELFLFAGNRFAPGRTWIVYDDKFNGVENIKIINLPSNYTPLIYGMWPIGVINMTESVICRAILDRERAKTADIITEQPYWSHAARTNMSLCEKVKSNNITKQADGNDVMNSYNTTLCEQGEDNLERTRWAIMNSAWRKMNWTFVEAQLSKAINYYHSQNRVQTQKQFINKEKRKSTERVLGLNIETDLPSQKTEEFDSCANNTGFIKVLTNEQLQPTNLHTNSNSGEKNDDEQKEKCATANEYKEPKLFSKTQIIKSQESEPNRTIDPNGIERLEYKSGDIVYIYPDGKKIYVKEVLKTIVFPDKSILYEYANNMKILERADGMRVTTFPDGRIHKESYRENASAINI